MSSAATAPVNAGELIVKWSITFRGSQPEIGVQDFVMVDPSISMIKSKAQIQLELLKSGIEPNPGPEESEEEEDPPN